MQVGAYGEGWPDIHMTPEDGAAPTSTSAGVLIPVHWCTFVLAVHAVVGAGRAAAGRGQGRTGVTLAIPRPGDRLNIDAFASS